MVYDFNNKVAIVTGASDGLGRKISKLLSEKGAHVVGVARREELLKTLQSEIEQKKGRFSYVSADLTRNDDIKKVIREVYEKFNGAEILVNNAGILNPNLSLDNFKEDPDKAITSYETSLKLNAISPAILYQLWLAEYSRRFPNVRKPGLCLEVVSISGFYSWAGGLEYQMSKTGLSPGFVPASRLELDEVRQRKDEQFRDLNLRHLCVYPDTIDTKMVPQDWERMPEEIAVQEIFKCLEGKGSYGEYDDIAIKIDPKEELERGIYIGFIPLDQDTKRPNLKLAKWQKIADKDKVIKP